MILLDTNVLSELMRPDPSGTITAWMDEVPAQDLSISCITMAEIERGIALMPLGRRRKRLREFADQLFELFKEQCLPFGKASAVTFASVWAQRERAGRPISTEDAQIAAIALVHKMKLATRNTRDFDSIRGLKLVNPWGDTPAG